MGSILNLSTNAAPSASTDLGTIPVSSLPTAPSLDVAAPGGMSSLNTLQILQGLSLGGSVISAFGQYQSGQMQKAAYDYNAAVALEQMREKMQTSEAKYSALTGRQASLYAKAGVDIASGSPLLVMAHTAAQGAIEQEREYQAGEEQAALDLYYGKVAAYSGTLGGISSFLKGLGTAFA